MGQIHEGRLVAGEKSLRKAPPCMHCCQPRRQSRLRRVLSTVANWIWVVYQGSCECAPDMSWSASDSKSVVTCGAREKRRLRTAMHHQSWYPTFTADVQNQKYCQSGKNAGVEFSRKWHTKLCPKSQQSQHHRPLGTCLKNGPTR